VTSAVDSLTIEISPRPPLSTTTTTRERSSSIIVLQTVAPSPNPTDDTAATSDIETDPILSASSLFTDADHPATTAGAAVSSSNTDGALPIGAIVGIILAALLVLSLLGFFVWTRKNKKDRDAEGNGDPYWERRFQELESVQSQSKPRLDTIPSPNEEEGTWRRHVCDPFFINENEYADDQLTLNLGSHHPVIARPASRLSQISSFFGQSQQSQTHRSPQTNRLSLIPETQSREEIDFSQPLADKWSLNPPQGQVQGQGRPVSSKSVRSRIGSRKSNSDSEKGMTERRSAVWPFSAIAAALSGSGNKAQARVEGGSRNGSIQERRGMEWIRTIVSSDSGFGFNHDPSRELSSSSKGLPPPPRRGVSPMALNNLQTSTRGLQPQNHSYSSEEGLSPNPISPDLVSPNPPPSYVTQSIG
jgi:hypothetical protein